MKLKIGSVAWDFAVFAALLAGEGYFQQHSS